MIPLKQLLCILKAQMYNILSKKKILYLFIYSLNILIDLVERELNRKLSTKIKIIELALMCSDFTENDLPDLPRIRITL